MVTLTPEIKQQLEIESDGRIRGSRSRSFIRIVPGSPAEAGLQAGDVIQSINNQPVNKTDEVQRLVERSTPWVASYKCKYNAISGLHK